jgi:hypothetical protein
MLFIVRGKNRNHERTLRVHAESAAQAEAMGWKRGLFVTEVTLVDSSATGILDRIAGAVLKKWRPTEEDSMKAFGSPVSRSQAAALLLLGCVTWCLDLKVLNFI